MLKLLILYFLEISGGIVGSISILYPAAISNSFYFHFSVFAVFLVKIARRVLRICNCHCEGCGSNGK